MLLSVFLIVAASGEHTAIEPIQIPHTVGAALQFPQRLVSICATAQKIEQLTVTLARGDDVAAALNAGFEAGGDKQKAAAANNVIVEVCDKVKGRSPLAEDDLVTLRSVRDDAALVERSIQSIIYDAESIDAYFGARTAGAGQSALSPLSPALLGGFEDRLIQGLADFVATRAEEEAILYLQTQLLDELCDKEKPSHGFFVHTCDVLTSIEAGFAITAAGASLQRAATLDLSALSDRALANVEKEGADAAAVARLALALLRAASEGRHPGDVFLSLHRVTALPCEKDGTCPTVASLRRASALSYAFRYGYDAVKQHVSDPRASANARLVFAAFLLDAEKQLSTAFLDVDGLWGLIDGAFDLSTLWRDLMTRIEDVNKIKEEAAHARAQLALLSEMLQLGARAATVFAGKGLSTDVDDALGAVAGMIEGLQTRNPSTLFFATRTLLRRLQITVDDRVWRLVPMLVEIADAKSSDEVARILRAAAAPAGSYASKYTRRVTSLTALVGLNGGAEIDRKAGAAPAAGFFAPVGVEVTWNICPALYVGAFASVIDVGALSLYRFQDRLEEDGETTDSAELPTVGVAQVFSPGLHVVTGLLGSPFVLGGGVAMSPALRKVTSEKAGVTTVEETPSLRVMGFLAIDVTIFGL